MHMQSGWLLRLGVRPAYLCRCGMSRRWLVVGGASLVGVWGRVGALWGRGVSADAQAYFGPRHGVAPGRVHDVMGVPADGGAAARSN